MQGSFTACLSLNPVHLSQTELSLTKLNTTAMPHLTGLDWRSGSAPGDLQSPGTRLAAGSPVHAASSVHSQQAALEVIVQGIYNSAALPQSRHKLHMLQAMY